jgi:hypothetical protein
VDFLFKKGFYFLLVPHTLSKKMNAIFRRAYTTKTLIPPNVAAATRLSGNSAKDGQITRLVDFYKVHAEHNVEMTEYSRY